MTLAKEMSCFLAGGEANAALADFRVVAVFLLQDELFGMHHLGRTAHIRVAGVLFA